MNKSEVPSSEVGWLQLKGVPEKVRVYKVRRELPVGGDAVEPAPALLEEKGAKAWRVPAEPPRREKKPKTLLGSLIPIIVLVGVFGPRLIRAIRGQPDEDSQAVVDTQARPCRVEIAKFCQDAPKKQRRACLLAREDELSETCASSSWLGKAAKNAAPAAATLPRPPRPPDEWNPKGVDAGLVAGINAVCVPDLKELCADVSFGKGRRFNCLWEHWDDLSVACRGAALPLFVKAAAK